MIHLTTVYFAAILGCLWCFYAVKVYTHTSQKEVVVKKIPAGLSDSVSFEQRKTGLCYLDKLLCTCTAGRQLQKIFKEIKMLKNVNYSICKLVLTVIVLVFVSMPSGCSSYEQMGETAAEGRRRHIRNSRIARQQLMADLDTFFLLDKPSKLTDKRIP